MDAVNESLDIEHAPRRNRVVHQGAFRPFTHGLCGLAFVRPTAHPAHHKRAVSPLLPLRTDVRHFVQEFSFKEFKHFVIVLKIPFMAKGISTTDPSPGQFLQKNRKKRSWEKAIVWNPRRQSLDIQKIADIEKGI